MTEYPQKPGPGHAPTSYAAGTHQNGWSHPPAPPPADQVDVARYWRVFKRRRWMIAAITALFTILALIIAIRSRPVYSTSSIVLVNPSQKSRISIADIVSPFGGGGNEIETDVNLIKTNTVLQYTAQILAHQGISLTPHQINQLIVVSSIPDTNLITTTTEWQTPGGAAEIADAVAQGFVNYQLEKSRQGDKDTVRFLGEELEKARRNLMQAEDRLQLFEQRTGVAAPGAPAARLSRGASSASAAMAAAMGGTPAPTGFSLSTPTGTGSLNSLVDQDLRAAEDKLNVALDQFASDQRRLAEVEGKLDQLDTELMSQQSGAVRDNNFVRTLRQQLNDKQAELAAARAQYTEAGVRRWHPGLEEEVASLLDRVNRQVSNFARGNTVDLELQQKLNGQLFETQTDMAGLQPQIAALRSRVAGLREEAALQPGLNTQLGRLLRDRDVFSNVYTMLLERQKQVEISLAAVQGDSTLVSHAEVPQVPIKPNRPRNVILGFLLGLIAGCGLAILLDGMDNSLRSWEDARESLGLPVLGAIPVGETQPTIIWKENSRSPASEAYRMLRSNVNFVNVDRPVKSILVSSAGPGEGKSSTVANLAAAMAQDGRRVVVLDADMRKPSAFRLLGSSRHIGLAEVLSGAHTVDEALRETAVPGVWTIPVDQLPPNPAELVAGQRMRELIAHLRDRFDVVLVDGPPALVVADSTMMAALVDAVILVVAASKTSRAAALRARDVLLAAHGNVVGLVLNRMVDEHDGTTYSSAYYEDGAARKSRRNGRSGHTNGSAP